MSNETELHKQAEALLQEAEDYFDTAAAHLFLEPMFQRPTLTPAEAEEWVTAIGDFVRGADEPSSPAFRRNLELRVHFLFPNLEAKERQVLTAMACLAEDAMSDYRESLRALQREFEPAERKLTPVQMLILKRLIRGKLA